MSRRLRSAGQIGIGHARQVNGLARDPARLLSGEFNRVRLGDEPLAPVLDRPAILGQERGVAIGAAERATDIGIARPVKAAAQDEASGW